MPETLEEMSQEDKEMLAKKALNISLSRKVFDFLKFGNAEYKGKFVIVYGSKSQEFSSPEDVHKLLAEVRDSGIHFLQLGSKGNMRVIYDGRYKIFDSSRELTEFKNSLDRETANTSISFDTYDTPGIL